MPPTDFYCAYFKKRALAWAIPDGSSGDIDDNRDNERSVRVSLISSNARRARGCSGVDGGIDPCRFCSCLRSRNPKRPGRLPKWRSLPRTAAAARVSARKNAARRRHASPREERRTCAHTTIEWRSRGTRPRKTSRSRATPMTIE